MAYGSLGSVDIVPGFDSVRSNEGSSALGRLPGDEFAMESQLAGQGLQAKAYLRAQQYQADAAKEAARGRGNPFLDLTSKVLGAGLSGFTGGLGTAAGKKWLA